MDERLTVRVGDKVRTCNGATGYVAAIAHGGLRVIVTAQADGGRKVGEFHPTKVWAV